MNKVANDLKNFAPKAPAGMEERIQKAMAKKKSFWTFSWYTLNVYFVGLLGIGAIAWMLSMRTGKVDVAQVNAPQENTEVSMQPAPEVKNIQNNAPSNSKAPSAKPAVEKGLSTVQIIPADMDALHEYSEVPPQVSVDVAPVVEVAESIEIQKMPEEIQVPYPKKEVIKAKGRTLKLTRLTGK